MTYQRQYGARDNDGKFIWVRSECADSWQPTRIRSGVLVHKDGIWIEMPDSQMPDTLQNEPTGRVIKPEAALEWFIQNDYEPPVQIQELAREHLI